MQMTPAVVSGHTVTIALSNLLNQLVTKSVLNISRLLKAIGDALHHETNVLHIWASTSNDILQHGCETNVYRRSGIFSVSL